MCPANCQSRGPVPDAIPVIVPNDVEPLDQLDVGLPNVVLFQTLVQFASKMNCVFSKCRGKVLRRPASRSSVPGLTRLMGLVRGAFPIKYCGVLVGDTFCGVVNALTSTYEIFPRYWYW